MGERAQRNLGAGAAFHIDLFERIGILPEGGGDLLDHVILIELGVHGGDLALAERIVERVIDQLGCDAQARSGPAIDSQRSVQAVVLLIAADVGQVMHPAHPRQHPGSPLVEQVKVIALQRVLILRIGKAAADAQVLRGLQV